MRRTSGHRCRALLAGAALTLAIPAATAWAQPATDRTPETGVPEGSADKATKFSASEYHKAGEKAFRGNRFSEALKLFRQAYGIVRRAETRLMIARTLAAQSRPVEAFDEAVAASAEAQPPIDAQAEQLVTSLKAQVAIVTVEVANASAGTAVVVNGKPLDEGRWGQPMPIAPGQVTVQVTNTGGEATEQAEIAAGGEATVKVTAPGAPATAAPVAPVAPTAQPEAQAVEVTEDDAAGWFMDHRRTIGIISAATGGILLVNFGIFGMLSNGQADRLEQFCPDPNDCDPVYQEEADKGQRFQTAANVMAGVGGVLFAAGAGLIVWDLLDADGDGGEQATLVIGPGGVGWKATF